MSFENTKKEIIQYFNSDEKLVLEDFDDGSRQDLDELRLKQGFVNSKYSGKFATAFYYIPDSPPFFEILEYWNEKRNLWICEYWDSNRCLFIFACKNERQRFSLLKEYIAFTKDLTIVERNLKYLIDKELE